MAERVDVPADARSHPKSIVEPLLTLHHVVDHILVVWSGLVMHRPAGVDKLPAALANQLAHIVSLIVGGAVPPHGEELDFDVGELTVFFCHALLDCGRDDQIDICLLVGAIIRTCVVFVDSLQPADVIVRVRDQVHEK